MTQLSTVIRLDAPSVARQHAILRYFEEPWFQETMKCKKARYKHVKVMTFGLNHGVK